MFKLLSRIVLGFAADAGRQTLDRDARLAMPPRQLKSGPQIASLDVAREKSIPTLHCGLTVVPTDRPDDGRAPVATSGTPQRSPDSSIIRAAPTEAC